MTKHANTFTLARIRKHEPCADGWKKLWTALGGIKKYGENTPITIDQIYESNGHRDTLWCLRTLPEKASNLLRHFAVDCAAQVKHLMDDERSLKALEVARRHANGKATDEELEKAYDAACAPRSSHAALAYDAADAAYAADAARAAHAADAAEAARAAHAARAYDAAEAARAEAARAEARTYAYAACAADAADAAYAADAARAAHAADAAEAARAEAARAEARAYDAACAARAAHAARAYDAAEAACAADAARAEARTYAYAACAADAAEAADAAYASVERAQMRLLSDYLRIGKRPKNSEQLLAEYIEEEQGK